MLIIEDHWREMHYSEISEFLKCTESHKFRYADRIETNRLASAPTNGTIGHTVLMRMLQGSSEFDAETAAWSHFNNILSASGIADKDDILDMKESAKEIIEVAKRGHDWLTRQMHFRPVLVEEHWSFKDQGFLFKGTVDLVLEDPESGALWLVDHKFRKSFRDGRSEDLNLQMAMYQKGLFESRGMMVAGSMQFQLYPMMPKIPKVNKDGKSIAKNDIMTDWQTYVSAVRGVGADENEYLIMKEKLEKHRFFDITSTRAYRSIDECNRVWHNVVMPVSRLIVDKNRKSIPVMSHMYCRNCQYRELCIEGMKGGDTGFLIKHAFHNVGDRPKVVDFYDDEE